ncbi:PREDICTED: uncharacterized protein LOC108975232 [Bactrocera latifrons]|uniref:Uncharacterized protein n=1 Tax=Bactrocera latifrons TaxID=174628 RepID=A0A0K8VK24_BACLA|nr:PREDICTED: uncharacterized protein LOC108975232 [Bactrocera latifrons]XP_018799126.1 PREDICTED: uncharacterized protein LOC108975232 [Bactrocera latifrons]
MMKMLQVNIFVASLCCVAFFNNFAQCETDVNSSKRAEIAKSTQPAAYVLQNWFTKNKSKSRLRSNSKATKNNGLARLYGQQSMERRFNADTVITHDSDTSKMLPTNSHTLNKKMLKKLGFTKVKAPNSHHRKRLAVESRRHSSPDDSHMFIIKLPPNFVYYTNPKGEDNSITDNSQKTNVSTFPFNSNGKPGRIYHWNLPVLQKILGNKQPLPLTDVNGKKYVINFKRFSHFQKPWENDSIEKSYKSNYKKSLKHKSPSYYAPTAAVKKNSFNRYFSGNGKPKGFYVIKENQHRAINYKNIVL